jgi:photosystem II stability/assembly factor-like uncharacterized protein
MNTQSILRAVVVLIGAGIAGLVGASESWQSLGPEGGYVLTLAVSPSNDSVVYAGTPAGVYRSEDGGLSWQFAGLAAHRVLVLSVDPGSSDLVYAGISGEGGVWGSRDGGGSWTPLRTGLEDPQSSDLRYLEVGSLAIDPDPSGIVRLWAGTSEGLFMTLASEADWTALPFPVADSVAALEVDRANPGRLFVAVTRASGLYRSTDHGVSWSPVAVELLASDPQDWRHWPLIRQVSVARSDPAKVYARSDETLYRSDDGGETWTESPVTDLELIQVTAMMVHPYSAETVIVATRLHGIFASGDGGATWTQISDGLECMDGSVAEGYVRGAAMAAASGSRLLLGTERLGVFSRSFVGGEWLPASDGLTATSPTRVATDPNGGGVMLASTSQLGMLQSDDGGASWQSANDGISGDCGPFTDPSSGPWPFCRAVRDVVWIGRSGRVLAASECGVLAASDAWLSWDRVPLGSWAGQIAVAGSHRDVVYAHVGNALHQSVDGGWTWSDCDELPDGGRIGAIAVSPRDADTVVVATPGGVYLAQDGCQSWQRSANVDEAGGLNAITFAGGDTLYAASSGGVQRSSDGGETWQSAGLGEYEATALAVRGTSVFAGTAADGVWVSHDAGTTWEPVNVGLDNLAIQSLTLSPDARRLFAATNGTGLYVIDVPSPPRRIGGRSGRPGPAPTVSSPETP